MLSEGVTGNSQRSHKESRPVKPESGFRGWIANPESPTRSKQDQC